MKDNKIHWYTLTYVLAFLIGVILFWSFGKDWLELESPWFFSRECSASRCLFLRLERGIFTIIRKTKT